MSSDDIVIREINEYFQELNFNKVIINGKDVFEHKSGFYMLTKSGTNSYFLEYARSVHEAKNNIVMRMSTHTLLSPLQKKKL